MPPPDAYFNPYFDNPLPPGTKSSNQRTNIAARNSSASDPIARRLHDPYKENIDRVAQNNTSSRTSRSSGSQSAKTSNRMSDRYDDIANPRGGRKNPRQVIQDDKSRTTRGSLSQRLDEVTLQEDNAFPYDDDDGFSSVLRSASLQDERSGRSQQQGASGPQRTGDPRYVDDVFPGVPLNPTLDDDVSAVTEAVHTMAPSYRDNAWKNPRNYYGDEEQPSIVRFASNDDDINTVDDFNRVFDNPTVAGYEEDERKAKAKRKVSFIKILFYCILAIIVILVGIFGILFGTGVLDFEEVFFHSSSASNSLVSPTASPTQPPTNKLLPVTSAPTNFRGNNRKPTPGPTSLRPTMRPTMSPTIPGATRMPTDPPVSAEPSSSPTVAPTMTPSLGSTPSPSEAATTEEPSRLPTALATAPPTQSDSDAGLVGSSRFALSNLNIRMEEEAYAPSTRFNDSDANITRNVRLEMVVNGRTIYRSYSCFLTMFCDPYTTIEMYEWNSFPSSTEWYLDGSANPGNEGLELGVLELRLYAEAEGGEQEYVWSVDTSTWGGLAQDGFETPSSLDGFGSGPWMRWQFDVNPINSL